MEVAGNPVLKSFAKQLHTPLIEHQLESFADDDWMTVAHAEHLLIAQALRCGDRFAAEGAMRAHIGRLRGVAQDVPDGFFSQS
jgi:DNA-binding GntR family transcriptional regulator